MLFESMNSLPNLSFAFTTKKKTSDHLNINENQL